MPKPFFDAHLFDPGEAEVELAAFKTLLDTTGDLAERDHVLAGFRDGPTSAR